MIVFGGTGAALLDDAWALSLDGPPAWTRIEATGVAPPPLSGRAAVYDAARDRMLVYGGFEAAEVSDRVWALDLASAAWTGATPEGVSPGHRVCSAVIYDPVRDRVVVWGGLEFFGNAGYGRNDSWILPLGSGGWSPLATSGAPADFGDAVFDAQLDRMV